MINIDYKALMLHIDIHIFSVIPEKITHLGPNLLHVISIQAKYTPSSRLSFFAIICLASNVTKQNAAITWLMKKAGKNQLSSHTFQQKS